MLGEAAHLGDIVVELAKVFVELSNNMIVIGRHDVRLLLNRTGR